MISIVIVLICLTWIVLLAFITPTELFSGYCGLEIVEFMKGIIVLIFLKAVNKLTPCFSIAQMKHGAWLPEPKKLMLLLYDN